MHLLLSEYPWDYKVLSWRQWVVALKTPAQCHHFIPNLLSIDLTSSHYEGLYFLSWTKLSCQAQSSGHILLILTRIWVPYYFSPES